MIDFNGQVAVVTGAGRGMGREIALLLAQRGAQVVVNDYGGDPEGHPGTAREAEAVVEEIRGGGGTAVANATTVGDGAGAERIIGAALTNFGRIDIDEIRDLSRVVHVGSSMEENMRYTQWLPWTGGRAGTF